MEKKIVLIDGHSILNRAFYGVPDLTNSQGLHTNAIYGFLNILFKIIDEEQPDYLTVAFDVSAPTFRHKMFEGYKGTRKPMSEELREQVPVMKEVLHAMGVKTIEKAGLEADDLLGTIANFCEQKGIEVSVISGDRDLLQLATEHVKIRIPKTKQGKTEVEDYYANEVKERYQVTPKEFIDLKALMGDASDNIPGVPSIGEKTATKIITEYGSIENAYAHIAEVKPPRASKALEEHYDLAQMSKELATIEVNAEIEFELEDAALGDLFTPEAYSYFQQLQFKNLLGRFQVILPTNKLEESFQYIADKTKAEAVFLKAKAANVVGVSFSKDTKNTLPLFIHESGIGGIGIAFGKEDIYVIHAQNDITIEFLLEQIGRLSASVKTIAMMDIKEAINYIPFVDPQVCFDVTVASYLLNPLKNDYHCEDVAREHLDLILNDKLELEVRACYEAYIVFASVEPLQYKLKQTNMLQLFDTIEMPLVFALYDMEQAGVKIESDALHYYGEQLGERIKDLETSIYDMAGEQFNINSPKQLGIVLFEHLELPNGKKTKTGYSTSADVLEKLSDEFSIVALILEYRQLTKLKSTYADGLANYIGADGRIHGTFNQTITATGRISSTEPNLQNIPIRMELGRLIRKVFIPEEGYVFVDADYSQIELRILAHCSGDSQLINAYKEAKDIHKITASQVFHTPFDDVTDLQRRNAKAVNFGIVYGISSFGLSQDLSITKKEAASYIERYFETYPGIKRFLDDTVEHAKKDGHVVTLFGRRRPIPELSSSNFMKRSFGERVAMNSPIQGTAADIMKIAMIGVNNKLKEKNMKSKVVLQVHDELLIEAHQEELEEVKHILKYEMEHAASLDVPLEIDMHTGTNWYETK
ncbi:DNA polymerase I [Lachnospiraceae bacterium LCP25S3_G4]